MWINAEMMRCFNRERIGNCMKRKFFYRNNFLSALIIIMEKKN